MPHTDKANTPRYSKELVKCAFYIIDAIRGRVSPVSRCKPQYSLPPAPPTLKPIRQDTDVVS
ncbi:uncharacterized protein RAG0_14148 [Rhynchosporium agropyri]|uniref:Uncharacterized protein n=2 Tax=Rhynchosporium TaxID=38037 RepID=A0A1E1MA59_RHYSE|nr:uncharacterized protein RAG0_14148 [Rhynchosporium agropyri]CZT45957.1 uncharacterized protein RSE6_06319 [Rhynchosporium secalis]